MTSQKEPAQAVRRRGRLVATAGVGAAVLVGSLIAAVPANAATINPTVTLTMPAKIANDGATTATIDAKIVTANPAAPDTGAIPAAYYDLRITIPAGVSCANVTLTGPTVPAGAPGGTQALPVGPWSMIAGGTGTTCDYYTTAPQALAANTTYEGAWTVTINGTLNHITGTVSGSFGITTAGPAFAGVPPTATNNPVLVQSSGSSSLVTPGPATFNTVPPVAHYNQPYSYQIIKDPGFPVTPENGSNNSAAIAPSTVPGGYTVVGLNPNGSIAATRGTATDSVAVKTGTAPNQVTDYYLSLNAADVPGLGGTLTGFFFDTHTGDIVFGTLANNSADTTKNTFTATSPTPVNLLAASTSRLSWIIVANNGQGGWDPTTAPLIPGFGLATAHDVASPKFRNLVQFTDVADSNPFASDIDMLAIQGIVNGYPGGAFGITMPVSRQAFAAFAGRILNLAANTVPTFQPDQTVGAGQCDGVHFPSVFKDVSNSNIFCTQIRDLASIGVLNGYKDGTFHPNAPISRQAIAAFLYRIATVLYGNPSTNLPTTSAGFNDVASNNPFSGDIKWLVDNKIANGYADGGFHPTAATTRQAYAAFLVRWVDTLFPTLWQ